MPWCFPFTQSHLIRSQMINRSHSQNQQDTVILFAALLVWGVSVSNNPHQETRASLHRWNAFYTDNMNDSSKKLRTITPDFSYFQTACLVLLHIVRLATSNTGVVHLFLKLKPLAPFGSRVLDKTDFLIWRTRAYQPDWRQLSSVPSCQSGKYPLAQGGSKLCSI